MATGIISKRQINWELVWTNSSPTSDFAAQTLSIDLSNYDAIMVVGLVDKGSITCITSLIIPKGYGGMMFHLVMTSSSSSGNGFYRRVIRNVNDSGLEFADAQSKGMNSTSAPTTVNNACIPLEIYATRF